MKKQCVICGQPSGMYPLCKEHLQKKNEGIVYKDENGNWVEKNDTDFFDDLDHNDIEYIPTEDGKCVVCGNSAPYGKQCKNCYYETTEFEDEIDKNRRPHELKEWYYNLKDKIFRMTDFEQIQSNCNKLIAIALLLKNIHNENSTITRVYNDIKEIIAKKQKTIKQSQEEIYGIDDEKNNQAGQSRALDGHWLENDLERNIDDMLYNLRIIHAYAKKVNEITERTVKCDWFIPILSNSKGIYIEFWGKKTPDYIKNKEEKIALYEKYEIPLIQIYKDELLNDNQLIQDRLETEINKLEKEIKKRKS